MSDQNDTLIDGDNLLIHKVNRPEFRLVVNSTKAAENDPGSSQGSGVAYERLPDSSKDQNSSSQTSGEEKKPELVVHQGDSQPNAREASEQIEFGNLVLEYQGSKKEAPVRPGLTTRYLKEGSEAKGLLLNKKAE